MLQQAQFEDDNADYAAFVEKFNPKKTTDDCYTPENIYNAVADWTAKKYGFDKAKIVRPFWPGGDYQRENYPEGCVVVDNPPFSILSKICRFYNAHGVKYFLFAPAMTLFCNRGESNYVVSGASVTYENGAVVNTSFITNLGEYLVESAPDLRDLIKAEDDKNRREKVKELPKYAYPNAVITAAAINYLAAHHTPYRLKREDALFIRCLDAQGGMGKTLFGGGFLLTEHAAAERAAAERAAAERAAAERAAATVWELSPREREIQRMLGSRDEVWTQVNVQRSQGD